MSPRRKRGGPHGDWRTAEQLAEDKSLSGTWYRCRRHGQTSAADVLVVGDRAYCTGDECTEPLLLVSHAMGPTMAKGDWNAADMPHARRVTAAAREDGVDEPRAHRGRPSVVFAAILKALDGGPMTRADLAALVYPGVVARVGQNRLGAALAKLERRGSVTRSRDAVWLAGDERAIVTDSAPAPAPTEEPAAAPAAAPMPFEQDTMTHEEPPASTPRLDELPIAPAGEGDTDAPAIVGRDDGDMDVVRIPPGLETAAKRKAKADGITVPQALLGFALLGAVPRPSRAGSGGDFGGEFSFRVSAAEVATWPELEIARFMDAFARLVQAVNAARQART